LDTMAENLLKISCSPQEASRLLYGPVFPSHRTVSVYLASAAKGAERAAFGLYWGKGSKWNNARGFERQQTQARALLFDVLQAVLECDSDSSLVIFTSSEYAIRSFCYWAGDNTTRGWPCTHADVLKYATSQIHA
ncbi:hypothetical protein B0H13DRAFT_1554240, partial [Mycena leptocephala]